MAQETAVIKRATPLRSTPDGTGANLARIEANTVVTRPSEREGAWTKVTTPQGAAGWGHMFDLAPQSGSAAPSNHPATSGLRGLVRIFGAPTALPTAQPPRGDCAAWAQKTLPTHNPTRRQSARPRPARERRPGNQFASNAALQPRSMPALAEPARPTTANPGGSRSPEHIV